MTEFADMLPARPTDGHKGTFGAVCVIGGHRSENGSLMLGAPAIAAAAAMRSGCGLCHLAMPEPLLPQGLVITPTSTGIELPVDEVGRLHASGAVEAIDQHAGTARLLALGPGLGNAWPQQQLVATLLSREDRPIVLDADGINALAALEDGAADIRSPLILTPHVGEFERLASAIGVDTSLRGAVGAEALAQRLGCIVVFKSHVTAISDGVHTVEDDSGGAVLATGGSGDVLTGIIASIAAQYGIDGPRRLLEAARLGVHLHALAGRLWQDEYGDRGMLATDLLCRIPRAIGTLAR